MISNLKSLNLLAGLSDFRLHISEKVLTFHIRDGSVDIFRLDQGKKNAPFISLVKTVPVYLFMMIPQFICQSDDSND